MKKTTTPSSVLAFCTVLFFSCNHTRITTSLPIKLSAFVYAVATHENEMSLAKNNSAIATGKLINLFVPYAIQGDEIRTATIYWIDAATGQEIKEIALHPSTDLSVMNINVPEELQGTSFLFASVPVESSLAGRTISVHSKIEGQWRSAEDKIETAFRIE